MTTESYDLQKHIEEILKKEYATFMATFMATMKEKATLKKENAMKKENATLKESLNTEEQNILNRDMKTEDDEEIEFKKFEENGEYGIMGKMFNAEAAQQREQNFLNRDMKTEDDEENCDFDLNSSIIEECLIKNKEEIISTSTKWTKILKDIWKSMPAQKILQTTTFNFKLTNENGVKGYNWCDMNKMSFQNKDANHSFKEIVNMVKVNNLTINMSIKLKTGRIVKY